LRPPVNTDGLFGLHNTFDFYKKLLYNIYVKKIEEGIDKYEIHTRSSF